jgi:hypothetical protein
MIAADGDVVHFVLVLMALVANNRLASMGVLSKQNSRLFFGNFKNLRKMVMIG